MPYPCTHEWSRVFLDRGNPPLGIAFRVLSATVLGAGLVPLPLLDLKPDRRVWAADLPRQSSPLEAPVGRPTLAQVTPSPTLPRPIEPRPQPTLPPPEQILQPVAPPPELQVPTPERPEELVPPAGEVTLVVDRFEVMGSTVFSEAELQAVLAPFVGRPLTLTELLQARTAITQLYVDRGYISSGAFIPPQVPAAGTVVIQVVEGQLVDIQVQGTTRLNPGYVSSRLALAAPPPLNVNQLVDGLRLLQLNPLIANISGELSAGLEPGTSLLTVTVEEADSFSVDLAVNNNQPPTVGTTEAGLYLNELNLTGNGDAAQLGYAITEGSDTVVASYQLPVNPRNGTLGAFFQYSDNRVITAPANILDITTESYLLDLVYRQPIILTPTEELALSLIGSWEKSRSEFLGNILGEPIPFPAFGANADGVIEVYVLRFAQDWLKRGRSDVVAARSQFSLGLGGSTPVNLTGEAPDGNFFAWLGQAQWAKLLAPDTLFIVRGAAQLANDTLPPQELFGLGGQTTIRGYQQDRLLTDNALQASAEVLFPILRDRERQGLLQIGPFLDVGTGWNTRLPNPNPSTLIGLGLGLLWTEGEVWTARLDWGLPLNGGQTGNSWQQNGFYFTINLTAF
ncbi:MAG TPA: ShlB/FhaC/HecB family hemolysin secretion/activation protein [Leptolyngbyaceae cyanobacterium M65_K2018_010]|nr:ShlB/FhaC/HecB family hemolysin secretion/activation protein [Leptolyngbyaceae cyanobacterium M65_K2018_010]